jgi:hypothetical protein
VNEIVVPCLSQWELAESLPDVIVREERPMNQKPLTAAEIEDFSLEIGERRGMWRAACAQHLTDLRKIYPNGMPR